MNTVILALLIMNVLFWSFFPHSAHCYFLDGINKTLVQQSNAPNIRYIYLWVL